MRIPVREPPASSFGDDVAGSARRMIASLGSHRRARPYATLPAWAQDLRPVRTPCAKQNDGRPLNSRLSGTLLLSSRSAARLIAGHKSRSPARRDYETSALAGWALTDKYPPDSDSALITCPTLIVRSWPAESQIQFDFLRDQSCFHSIREAITCIVRRQMPATDAPGCTSIPFEESRPELYIQFRFRVCACPMGAE